MTLDPAFAPLLGPHDPSRLDQRPELALGLFADGRIGYANPAYFRAALAGAGPAFAQRWGVGAGALDAMGGPFRPFFSERFAQTLASGAPWHHTYECPTPEQRQTFRLTAFPLRGGAGLLCLHTLVMAVPHSEGADAAAAEADYRDGSGLLHQCASCRRCRRCRRARRGGGPSAGEWVFVPEFVRAAPPRVSHGLCEACAAQFWGAAE